MYPTLAPIAFPGHPSLPEGATILAADVGGTKTHLALFELRDSTLNTVRYLAIESSNLALKLKATGGIFIGGGVAPKIWNDQLRAVFLEHFFEVGRLRPLIETVPLRLVLNQKLALLGAAYYGV